MDITYLLAGVFVMASVTYLPRALPMAAARSIKTPYIRRVLEILPFTVLGAMIFPGILYATATPWSGAAGLLAAIGLAWRKWGLLSVALAATAVVFMIEQLIL